MISERWSRAFSPAFAGCNKAWGFTAGPFEKTMVERAANVCGGDVMLARDHRKQLRHAGVSRSSVFGESYEVG